MPSVHVRKIDGKNMAGSNRNYAAMAPGKLRESMRDLNHGNKTSKPRRSQKDDAWWRCVQAGGDPRVDAIVCSEALGAKFVESA